MRSIALRSGEPPRSAGSSREQAGVLAIGSRDDHMGVSVPIRVPRAGDPKPGVDAYQSPDWDYSCSRMRNCTRRFFVRPSSVSLDAIEMSSP